jgi:hypothetical protein
MQIHASAPLIQSNDSP